MKILIWGTGRLSGRFVGHWIEPCRVFAYIDSHQTGIWQGKPVITPEAVVEMEYDAILVVNLYTEEIYQQCQRLGIDLQRVIFLYENIETRDINQDYEFVKSILGDKLADKIRHRYHLIREPDGYTNELSFQSGYDKTDYVRIKTFDMVVQEIRKRGLHEAVAEAGVFKGEFAQYINAAFPDSRLYLFDTFEGFVEAEAEKEKQEGNCTDGFVKAYQNVGMREVMQKMTYPAQVEIRQGMFPDTAQDITEKFMFVSLDMDFEASIYAGLDFFYPKLVEGGYLFVHDYNSDLKGVEKAVDQFEQKYGKIRRMPIPDVNGTLVILK